MRTLLLSFLILISAFSVDAQGEVPVNMNTGTAQISIPLAAISGLDLSDQISLVYNATGMKVQDPSGYYGMGWSLAGGGSISRQVRSLPDDWTGTSTDVRRGWFYTARTHSTTLAANVGGFPNSADTVSSTFTDETADYDSIAKYAYNLDSEPDIFSFQFGQYSGNFVFDNASTPAIHLFPYADLKVTFVQGTAGDKSIKSFTITTNDGVQYLFDQVVTASHSTSKLSPFTSVQFNQRDFSLYDFSRYSNAVAYTAQWMLSKITSPLGATISYAYTPQSQTTTDTMRFSVKNYTGGAYSRLSVYTDKVVTSVPLLTGVAAQQASGPSGNSVTLTYDGSTKMLSDVVLTGFSGGMYRHFGFTYHSVSNNAFGRFYLATITQDAGNCLTLPPYRFTYTGDDSDEQLLPGPWSNAVDFWGYYNGVKTNVDLIPTLFYYPLEKKSEQIRLSVIPSYAHTQYSADGADRTCNPSWIGAGMLESIQWPLGGMTVFTFEANDFLDQLTNQTIQGGGLRIKKVTYFDGLNGATNITKTYSYTDSTGIKSTGRLISRPVFAMPTMRYVDGGGTYHSDISTSDWSYMMVRSEKDLSASELNDGSYVTYAEVKVQRSGSGTVRYHYLLPGTYGNPASGSWLPTTDKIVRSTNISTGTIVNGGPWIFSYAANPNFSHERGLVWLKQEYSEDAKLVRQTQTYYQYLYKGSSAYSVYGLHFDFLPNSTNTTYYYGKYTLLTDLTKVTKAEKITTYDQTHSTRSQALTTSYFYGTGPHRLLIQTTTYMPDGTQYYTRMRYPLDYGTVPGGSDMPSTMIGQLQTNFQNGSPVETTSLIKKPGSIRKYTGASLTLYDNFSKGTKVFPKYSYSLTLSAPRDTASFALSQVVSHTFTYDTAYQLTNTITAINAYGTPQNSVGVNLQRSGTGWGYSNTLPVVAIQNADCTQIGFSDFETGSPAVNFTRTDSAYYGNGHTGTKAIYPKPTLTRVVSKAPVNNYILSFWINSSSSTSFTVKLFNGSGTQIGSTMTVSVPSTGGAAFRYFSKVIPVTGVTTSTMSITLGVPSLTTVSANSPGLLPVIDDVSFYPSTSALKSYTYTQPYGASSITSGNQTSYTVYDNLGRKRYLLDTQGNIKEKDTYYYPGIAVPVFAASFGPELDPGLLTDGPFYFSADPNACLDGVTTYRWKLNHGSYMTGAPRQLITLPVQVSDTISLIVSNPGYKTDTITHIYNHVGLAPIIVDMCADGAANVQICDDTGAVTSVAPSYFCSDVSPPSFPTGLVMHPEMVGGDSPGESVVRCSWYQKTHGTVIWGDSIATSTSLINHTLTKVLANDFSGGYDWMVKVTTQTADGRHRVGTASASNYITHTNCSGE